MGGRALFRFGFPTFRLSSPVPTREGPGAPGAIRVESELRLTARELRSRGSMVTAVYLSSDPPDKIVAFYKERLGDKASVVRTGNGTVLSAGEKDRDNIVITITPQGDSTKIAIVRVTSNKTE